MRSFKFTIARMDGTVTEVYVPCANFMDANQYAEDILSSASLYAVASVTVERVS